MSCVSMSRCSSSAPARLVPPTEQHKQSCAVVMDSYHLLPVTRANVPVEIGEGSARLRPCNRCTVGISASLGIPANLICAWGRVLCPHTIRSTPGFEQVAVTSLGPPLDWGVFRGCYQRTTGAPIVLGGQLACRLTPSSIARTEASCSSL